MIKDIRIRRYQLEDAGALYEAAQESVAEVYPWLSWCHPGFTLEDAQKWAKLQNHLFGQGTEYEFVIVDSEDRYLGGCGLNHINAADRMANLGYWVRTSATGNGIATRVVQLLADFAFSQTNLERLEIVCAVGNEASNRVAINAGAVAEGVLRGRLFLNGQPRDAYVYSIIRADFIGP